MAQCESSGSDAVTIVENLLRVAVLRSASDVCLEPGFASARLRMRLDGLLVPVDEWPADVAQSVITRLKVLGGLLTYRTDIPQEGAFTFQTPNGSAVDMRVSTFPTIRGERAAIRVLCQNRAAHSLSGLGLANDVVARVRAAAIRPQGMIICTGPAGSGKSTTLYAVARHILEATPHRSVVSLEDPVEQRIEGLTQIQVQPHGELNYVRAMRSLLRQDVQVLLVGEIRDAETARVAIEAALTGHLVLTTMHSGDPAEALVRLAEMGAAPYQIVSAVTVVLAQRLVRKLCDECPGEGCDRCVNGYSGRTAFGQMAVIDEGLRGLVLDRAPASRIRRYLADAGPDLKDDAKRLVDATTTDREEVLRVLGAESN